MKHGIHLLLFWVTTVFIAGCSTPAGHESSRPKWPAYWQRQHRGVVEATVRVNLEIQPSIATHNTKSISLPLVIDNQSNVEIATTLAHEWHGGVWPSTDLYASVTPAGTQITKEFHPVYLVGEDRNAARLIKILSGQSVTASVRMDWKGTGSCPAEPLMDSSVCHLYRVSFLLVFDGGGKKQYTCGQEFLVELHE